MRALLDLGRRTEGPDLQALLQSLPYVAFLGVIAERRGDELTFSLPFKPELIGNTRLPALHGGAVGAFLETAAIVQLALLASSEEGERRLPKTIDFSIEYLRSGRPVDTYARADVAKIGRRIANVRVFAWQGERDRPIAAGHGHFLLSKVEPPDAEASAG